MGESQGYGSGVWSHFIGVGHISFRLVLLRLFSASSVVIRPARIIL